MSSNLVIRTRCVHCGWEQNTNALKYVRCFKCGKTYVIFPKNSNSRIVKIIKGDIIRLHNELYRQKIYGVKE